ncbi:MAG: hypothetical protein ABEJ74_04045 [Haloferacaceae archaeon]
MTGEDATDEDATDENATDEDATGEHEGSEAVHVRVRRLHEHLEATAERPVAPAVSPYLGEAEAVAADVARDPSAPSAAVRTRVEQVRELLSHVDGTGDARADDHVEAARSLATAILDRLER